MHTLIFLGHIGQFLVHNYAITPAIWSPVYQATTEPLSKSSAVGMTVTSDKCEIDDVDNYRKLPKFILEATVSRVKISIGSIQYILIAFSSFR